MRLHADAEGPALIFNKVLHASPCILLSFCVACVVAHGDLTQCLGRRMGLGRRLAPPSHAVAEKQFKLADGVDQSAEVAVGTPTRQRRVAI